MAPSLSRGAVLVRIEGRLAFLSSHVARKILPVPPLARIVGAPEALLGIALVDGLVVPVAALGPSRNVLVLLSVGEQPVGLTGVDVVATGVFPVTESGHVVFHGHEVSELDLGWLHELGRPASLPGKRRDAG